MKIKKNKENFILFSSLLNKGIFQFLTF